MTVSATFSDDTATKQYSTDNSTWKTYTKGITMTQNGMVYFRGIDAAGNISDVVSYEVTNIDKIAPEAPSAVADITSTTNQDVTVTATFSDDTATRQYSTDNKTWKSYSSGVEMSANGTVYFRGIDAAGNISDVTSYEVTNIDKVAPEAPTASANITEMTNQDVTVTATFSDDTATRQYSTDNKTWKAYTKGVALTQNGTIWFRGIDAAGNVSEVSSYEVTNIDKIAPDAPAASASTTALTNKNVTVSATFSDDTATKQYSTDNKTWKAYSKGVALTQNGTIWFRGIDAAGNISNVTSYEVTNIDKTAPAIVIGLSAAADRNTLTFAWETTTDNLAGVAKYEIEISDTEDFSHVMERKSGANLTSHSASFTASGTIYYRVRATDAAGNASGWSSASVEFEFTDATPPTVPGNLQVVQEGAQVTFSWDASTDAESGVDGYTLRLVRNGRTETTTQVVGTSVTVELPESDYAWSVMAADSFGNVSEQASGQPFRLLLSVGEPHIIAMSEDGMAELATGTFGDDTFVLTADSTWGTFHGALWNGGEDGVPIGGFNRFHDSVIGNGGYDMLQLPDGENALLYNDLISPSAESASPEARFAGISEIVGGAGRDVIDLTDTGTGYPGDILLKGGAGDDHLWAGSGDDILIGGDGDDDLRGGTGNDVYLFGADWGHDTVLDDGGTLVFDESFEGTLAFSDTADGTRITAGSNTVELNWTATSSDVVFSDVGSLSEMRRDTIRGFLA